MSLGQVPQYNMTNMTATDCIAEFFDSDANSLNPGDYDHNENYVFRICVPQATSITLTFTSFCTELNFDTIFFYDGPSITSPPIGNPLGYHGATIPTGITSTDSCLTIRFRSDNSVSCTGWEAMWRVDVPDPIPPNLVPDPQISCYSDTIMVWTDSLIRCDSVQAANYAVIGPNPTDTTWASQASAQSCTANMTDEVMVILDQPLSVNCTYDLLYIHKVRDDCDSLWIFEVVEDFTVDDCSLDVEITPSRDTICFGECVDLLADVTASYCTPTNLGFTWIAGGFPATAGPHTDCPGTTTTYTVVATDTVSLVSDTASISIYVVPPIQEMQDTAVCVNDVPFNLYATPTGGTWRGFGIIDSVNGTFDPDSAQVGLHTIVYRIGGCYDTVVITVNDIYVGFDDAACVGSPPFLVSGGTPVGGTWSDPSGYITGGGMFDPVASGPGSHPITYTTLDGCSESKFVNIDTLMLVDLDTVCESLTPFTLTFSPVGGTWSGPGIMDSLTGLFNPNVANTGLHDLVYTVNGCSDTIDVFVIQIDARWNETACPTQAPFTIIAGIPVGGTWSGNGIIDSVTGLFDPGWASGANFNAMLTYTANGCTDIKYVYVRQTAVRNDTVEYCPTDTNIRIDLWTYTQRNVAGGVWQGPGITGSWPWTYFQIDTAGPGLHKLYYTMNTCTDSMAIRIHPWPTTQADTGICILSDSVYLTATPPGGIWWGSGITDTFTGLFEPPVAGKGPHRVYYQSPGGCLDSMLVTVDTIVVASFSGLQSSYCFKDTNITLTGLPAGGMFGGPGVVGNTFNPALAGAGTHVVYYGAVNGSCSTADSFTVEVLPQLIGLPSISLDTLCYDEGITFSIDATGGDSLSGYVYNWNNGLGYGRLFTVYPKTTTNYIVTVTDGCSDPWFDTVTIFVTPEILINYSNGPLICYGQQGYATIDVTGSYGYIAEWNTSPTQFGDSLIGTVGLYQGTLTDTVSGCQKDLEVEIPGYRANFAFFNSNPASSDCHNLAFPVNFIDMSTQGITGYWDWGDGTTSPYTPPMNPYHNYPAEGTYTILLHLQNTGGCISEYTKEICIFFDEDVFIPNTFTPNGDGLNDYFEVYGLGITDVYLKVFNQWGQMVYLDSGGQGDVRWNGKYNGQPLEPGVYVYVARVNFINGASIDKTGSITILK
jgi:gliding motility-associated-like protein